MKVWVGRLNETTKAIKFNWVVNLRAWKCTNQGNEKRGCLVALWYVRRGADISVNETSFGLSCWKLSLIYKFVIDVNLKFNFIYLIYPNYFNNQINMT